MFRRKTMLHKRCDVRDYLDEQINWWRVQRDKVAQDTEDWNMAVHYIDAFQLVRLAIFEQELSPEPA
jgi:hypothetical protein